MALEVGIWTDGQRAELVRAVLDLMGSAVRPIGVGGPRVAEVAQLAADLETVHEDDLRKLLVERPSTFVFLATARGFEAADLRPALAGGSTVLTLEPVAAGFDELASLRKTGTGAESTGRIVRVPDLRQGRGWRSAAEPFDALGPVRAIGYWSFGRPGHCSLFSRLYEAWQVVLSLTSPGALPHSVTATLTGSLPQPPESLRVAAGHLSAQAAMDAPCGVALQCSDQAGLTARELNVIGQAGHLRVSDDGYALFDSDGRLLDHRQPGQAPLPFADLVAEHWRRLLDQPAQAAAAPDESSVLACCLASLLSARTGQPERPRKLLEMHR